MRTCTFHQDYPSRWKCESKEAFVVRCLTKSVFWQAGVRPCSCFQLKTDLLILRGIPQQLPHPYQYSPSESNPSARGWQILKTKRLYCHTSTGPATSYGMLWDAFWRVDGNWSVKFYSGFLEGEGRVWEFFWPPLFFNLAWLSYGWQKHMFYTLTAQSWPHWSQLLLCALSSPDGQHLIFS